MKRKCLLVVTMIVLQTLTACGMSLSYRLDPTVGVKEESVLYRAIIDDKTHFGRGGQITGGQFWEFYLVDEYSENGTFFYSTYIEKGRMPNFGEKIKYEYRVHGIFVYNPRVNLVIRVPWYDSLGGGSTVSKKPIYNDFPLQFLRPVGRTKQFLQALAAGGKGYHQYAMEIRKYKNILKERPINEKEVIDNLNSYSVGRKDKNCEINARILKQFEIGYSTDDVFTEKYCILGYKVLDLLFFDLAEIRGEYQQRWNGISPEDNSTNKDYGYEKVNLWEESQIMKKLPVSYESKLGKKSGVLVHDGPPQLWLVDNVSNFLAAFAKL